VLLEVQYYMGIAAQGLCGNEVEVHRALWAMSHDGRGGRGGRGKVERRAQSSSSEGKGTGAITSKGKGEGNDLETYDERPTMRDQETQTSDGVLCMTQDELKQTVLKQAIGMAKQLVQESAALEIISGPLQAAEDLERRVQEGHTGRDEAIRKESIRRLRDSLDALI